MQNQKIGFCKFKFVYFSNTTRYTPNETPKKCTIFGKNYLQDRQPMVSSVFKGAADNTCIEEF
jgi:hypothetical protein